MQSRSRALDDLSNLMTNAVGAVKGVGDEVKAMGRSQVERLIADMDLIGRDEFEILKDMVAKQREETEALKTQNKSLQKQVTALKKQISKGE